MAELNLEKINNNMYGLVQIQKEMLTILRASSTAMKAQTTAMGKLAKSAKEVGDEVEKTQTKLGRFIEKKLRATHGAAGIFHKLMYGVPGYFIFKNRLDTLLSGIDKFIMQPLSGNKKKGFLNNVLYGVGGSFRRSKDQIETIMQLSEGPITGFQGPAFQTKKDRLLGLSPKGPAELTLKKFFAQSKLVSFISKSSIAVKKELQNKKKLSRYRAWLGSKGVSFLKKTDKVLKKAGMFFAVSLLVFAKVGLAILAGLIAMFFLVKILKKMGITGEFLEKWAKGIVTVAMGGIMMVAGGLGRVVDGIVAMYEAIFQGGSIYDLFSGFLEMGYGLLEVFGGLLLILFSPLLGAIQGIIGDYGESIEEKVVALLQLVGIVMIGIGALIALVAAVSVAAVAGVTFMMALPFILGGLFLSLMGLLLMKINPFANGGVTKSGLSLVGERGPELVRLPKGSRVHSNQESRKMVSNGGNNITVNINGRVGSSDSELRIIAQKVGNMINKEINRTTSSRSLGA
jgi:hypothetical protein